MSIQQQKQNEIELLIAQLDRNLDFSVNKEYSPRRSINHCMVQRKRKRTEKLNRIKVEESRLRRKKYCEKLDRRIGIAESDSSSMGPIDTRHGVQLNSREITSIAERLQYTGDHDMSDATIRETPWDLARIVERPTLVTSFRWSTNVNDVIYRGTIPASVLPIKLARIPFETFQYWRGDVTLRLQVAGSPLVQGILAMTFVPLVDRTELDSMSWDLCSLSINPTVYLFANTNTHAELRIPFNHFQSYLNTDFPSEPLFATRNQNLGCVIIYVLQPLKTGGTVTSVNVSLFSILENSQFKVPRLSSAIGAAESGVMSAISSLMQVGGNLLSPLMESVGTHARHVVDQVSSETVEGLISKVASKALPVNLIGDSIDAVGDVLSGALGFLGLDNPTIPTEMGRHVIKTNGSMNYAIGPEHIEKMSVMPSAMSLVTPETFATVTDEMDVDYLYRRYSYLASFNVPVDAAAGSVIWNVPMSPFPTLVTDPTTGKSVVPAGSIIQKSVWFPLISYLGLPYRYWTGGLKYKFIVSASSMHTCKLYVAFNYGITTNPVNLLDASSQYGVAIEINQGSNEFEFSVPYVATRPYLEVCRGNQSINDSMGIMSVVVMNPLVAPVSVAQSIDVVVFVAGSDDFSYEFLAQMNPAIPVFATGKPNESINVNDASAPLNYNKVNSPYCQHDLGKIGKAESGLLDTQSIAPTNVTATVTDVATPDEDNHDHQVAPPQLTTTVDDHFGITSISLRNMLKKYQMVQRFPLFELDPTSEHNSVYCRISIADLFKLPLMVKPPGGLTPEVPDSISGGLMAWATGMFRQFKGSLRFKIVVSSVSLNIPLRMSAFFLPGPIDDDQNSANVRSDISTMMAYTAPWVQYSNNFYFTAISTPRMSILNGVLSNVLEFEIPYSSPFLSVLTNSGLGTDRYAHGLGEIFVVVDGPNLQLSATVYMAFGDEARFGTLYRVPTVYAPAILLKNETGYRIWSNFARGTYAVSAAGRAEGGSTDLVSQVRGFIASQPSVTFQEVVQYVLNLTGNSFNTRNIGGLIHATGATVGRDGRLMIPFHKRYRNRSKRRKGHSMSQQQRQQQQQKQHERIFGSPMQQQQRESAARDNWAADSSSWQW